MRNIMSSRTRAETRKTKQFTLIEVMNWASFILGPKSKLYLFDVIWKEATIRHIHEIVDSNENESNKNNTKMSKKCKFAEHKM